MPREGDHQDLSLPGGERQKWVARCLSSQSKQQAKKERVKPLVIYCNCISMKLKLEEVLYPTVSSSPATELCYFNSSDYWWALKKIYTRQETKKSQSKMGTWEHLSFSNFQGQSSWTLDLQPSAPLALHHEPGCIHGWLATWFSFHRASLTELSWPPQVRAD